MEKQLIYNAIKTPDGTILHSKHHHDFVTHIDKNGKTYGIDGGNTYRRFIGDYQDCEDLVMYDDGEFKTRREYLYWGQNFDKDMNPLPKTIWRPIRDLNTDHIEAIILGNYCKNLTYLSVFVNELEYRKKLENNGQPTEVN